MTEDLKAAKPTEQVRVYVETVHGRMVDLSTGIEYTRTPKEVIRINGWLQAQIDAGKMKSTEQPVPQAQSAPPVAKASPKKAV